MRTRRSPAGRPRRGGRATRRGSGRAPRSSSRARAEACPGTEDVVELPERQGGGVHALAGALGIPVPRKASARFPGLYGHNRTVSKHVARRAQERGHRGRRDRGWDIEGGEAGRKDCGARAVDHGADRVVQLDSERSAPARVSRSNAQTRSEASSGCRCRRPIVPSLAADVAARRRWRGEPAKPPARCATRAPGRWQVRGRRRTSADLDGLRAAVTETGGWGVTRLPERNRLGKRRGRDLNPRSALRQITVFETAAPGGRPLPSDRRARSRRTGSCARLAKTSTNSSTKFRRALPGRKTSSRAKRVTCRDFFQRSGAGVEPTHRRATPAGRF
jgi:hypothetical protein